MTDDVPPPSIRPAACLVLALPRGDEVGASVPGLMPVGGLTLLRRLLLVLDQAAAGIPVLAVTAPSALSAVEQELGARGTAVASPAQTRLGALADGLGALGSAGPADRILVHDAERGLTPPATIVGVLEGGAQDPDADAVVPGIPVTDSVKARGPRGLVNVDRSGLTALQCPRLLARGLLERVVAAAGAGDSALPDDEIRAALALGARVRVIPGSHDGGPVVDRLGLWQAQISLGLARDTTPRDDAL